MQKLVAFFIDNYKFTMMVFIFVTIGGVLGMSRLNSESFPSVNFAMAKITTRYPGASPSDVEIKITKPLEDEIRKVSGLKDVRSTSQAGTSKILVRIDMDNEDEDKVMADLRRAVDGVSDLPSDLLEDPVFNEINSEEFPVIEIAITGENTNRERDELADHLKEELEDNKRILNVRPVGFYKREFNILLNREKLEKYHIGINEVLNQIRKRNINIPGGDLESSDGKKLVRVEGKINNAKELSEIVVRSNFTGQRILLGDIAKVIDGKNELDTLASYNGKDATLLVVNKRAGADTIALVDDVEKILDRFSKDFGKQFTINVYSNEAKKVKNRLDILTSNALSGLALVLLFLLIFLPGKIGLVASLSLPIAVMATFGLMPTFDMNLNAITILALVIALGMLVDNSVVIAENFTRLRKEGMPGKKAAQEAVSQIWLPISITAFTTIAAFLPMLVTKGIMGQFILFIPIVVTISLLMSLFEGFFLLPTRLIWAGKKIGTEQKESKDWFDKFVVKFENFMSKAIRHRYITFTIFSGILLFAFGLMTLGNKFMLFPPDQTEVYIARFETPRGSTIEQTQVAAEKLSESILKLAGPKYIEHVVARAGNAEVGPADPKSKSGDNVGMVIIYATDYAKFNVPYTEMLKKLRTLQPDYLSTVSFEERVNGPPVGEPINATFRSNNEEELNTVISSVKNELAKIDGVFDLNIDNVIGDDEVYININYAKANRLGLSALSIGEALRTGLTGTVVSNVVLNNKEIDLRVRFDSSSRNELQDLNDVTIMDGHGNLVPISLVANYDQKEGSPQIRRFDFKRSKTLTGSVDPTKITSVEANTKLRSSYKKLRSKYPGVSLVFGGESENTKESMESLGQALILALIGIFALLVFLFRSYSRPIIIMSTIPLGLVGFSIAFFLEDRPISFLAMIGIIGLAGIIVNSGIVLIAFIDMMRSEAKLHFHTILAQASGMRLRAVLVTSLTTIGGLLPTAYGIGGSEAMLIPMTLAMAWGLTSGTILTLVWVPCFYAIIEDIRILILQSLGKREEAELVLNPSNGNNNVTLATSQSQQPIGL